MEHPLFFLFDQDFFPTIYAGGVCVLDFEVPF